MRPFPPWLARFENQDLEIHEAPNGHVFVKDLTLVPVKNITEVGRFSTALAVMFLSVKSKTSRTLVALFPFVPVAFA